MAGKDETNHHNNNLGEVRACGCGGVNLVIGPMTLHFTADEALALFDLAGAAKQLVEAGPQRRRTKKRRGKSKVHGTLH